MAETSESCHTQAIASDLAASEDPAVRDSRLPRSQFRPRPQLKMSRSAASPQQWLSVDTSLGSQMAEPPNTSERFTGARVRSATG